jgi:alkylation response protein AidB-like acyl-CoA dehydrogenase
MPFQLSATEEKIVKQAAEIALDAAASAAAEVDREGRLPNESFDALRAAGLLGLTVPREFGGMAAGPRVFVAVTEKLAEKCASTAMCYTMHIAATASFVVTTTLKDRGAYLEEIAAGRHLTTLAYSEQESRSVFWAPMSKLEETSGSLRTRAKKSWITSAREASSYVASAQMPGAASPQQSVIYLVDTKDPRVKIGPKFDGVGMRGNDSSPVELDNVEVSYDRFFCPPGEGLAMMLQVTLPWFTLGSAAVSTGIAAACVSETARHLSSTGQRHTGATLRDISVVRARLGRMTTVSEQARALLGFAARKVEQPDEATPLHILRTRLATVEAAMNVTDLGMKSCGGAAFSRHLSIERNFRDARAGWVMAPTADHVEDFLGRALTGMPLLG